MLNDVDVHVCHHSIVIHVRWETVNLVIRMRTIGYRAQVIASPEDIRLVYPVDVTNGIKQIGHRVLQTIIPTITIRISVEAAWVEIK